MKRVVYLLTLIILISGCHSVKNDKESTAKLIIIDPQHFHAALVQKVNNPLIDNQVGLYAEQAPTVEGYKSLIQQYNSRSVNPTSWKLSEYYGNDFLTKAISEDKGDVVVLAGDNKQKINYIAEAVKHHKTVFADKPLVINDEGFNQLKQILENREFSSMVYDIMTERYDVKNIIIKHLVNNKKFSGGFEANAEKPLIEFKSTHHFIKSVSGKPLVRPAMFFDVNKQGEGLVDVTTHYIDLVQWILASDKPIELNRDVLFKNSSRWSTNLSKTDFEEATALKEFPKEFKSFTNKNEQLEVFSNGKMDYMLFGVPISLAVQWNVKSLDGKGDQFTALFNTENIKLEVRPDKEGKSSIYIMPKQAAHFDDVLNSALKAIKECPGLSFVKESNAYKIIIPEKLYLSHEDHFAKVLHQFLEYKKEGKIPDWEKSFMLTKYYLTTQALKHAQTQK